MLARPEIRETVFPGAGRGETLDLSECRLLFSGEVRDVFQHPADDQLLIKVFRAERKQRANSKFTLAGLVKRRFNISRVLGIHRSTAREIKEMLRAAKMAHRAGGLSYPFAQIHGFIQTTAGLGLVVEKITGSDGAPAPTMRKLLMEGRFTPKHHEKFLRFFEICEENHYIFGDLHAGNLVYVDGGDGQFICIDGAGEKALIPIHEILAWANRRKLARSRQRMEAEIERRLMKASAKSKQPTHG